MISFILIALLQVAGSPDQGTIRGLVRSEGSGAPLVAATVEVVDGPSVHRVSADRNGSYLVRGVTPGRRVVRARHVGHTPLNLEVVVPQSGELWLDLVLPIRPIELDPVRVDASSPRSASGADAAPPPELAMAGARAIESTPGLAEMGLTEAARGVPGQEPADPSHVLFIRGAAADLKLVYLDGAPVYAPFPLGGILDPFTPDLLRSADVYLGGAPARYDGGLSYILDLRTRRARSDGIHSSGAVDLLSSRVLVETPLGESGGIFAGARGVHRLGLPHSVPYGYREGIVRGDLEIGSEGLLSLTGFTNAEQVWLESGLNGDSAIAWGNTAFSMRYRSRIGLTGVEVTASQGDFQAELPLDGRVPMHAAGSARRSRLSLDLARRIQAVQLRYGASYDLQRQHFEATPLTPAAAANRVGGASSGEVLGVYADAVVQLDRRFQLRGGLRADRFSVGSEVVIAPRLAATWLVTERAALTLAGGRYNQYLRAPDAIALARSPELAESHAGLGLGRASHLSLSFDQELGEGMRFGMEGFFKNFSGVPGLTASEANASGVDTWIRRNHRDLSGWLGYSLAWAWSVPQTGAASQFSGRQLLSAGATVPIRERGSADIRFSYGAGLPYSAIPIAVADGLLTSTPRGEFASNPPPSPESVTGADAPPLLPQPDRSFLRLELAASHTFERRWWNAPVEISPYLRLLNTLGRRDALFYHYDRSRDAAPRPLATLPIVPVLGVEWKF